MMTFKLLGIALLALMPVSQMFSQSPSVVGRDGEYLGTLNKNRYDPNSVANPYGAYGSRYSPNSVNNPYGRYGSKYSSEGATNPYGSAQSPSLIGDNGKYLGRLNDNKYDPESVSNPYGRYGSPYSPESINNPYGQYGSPYSPNSANNPYTTGRSKQGSKAPSNGKGQFILPQFKFNGEE
jgi:hypothetical protein